MNEWPSYTVWELQTQGVLHVEDGNHGEYRPRPSEFVSEGNFFIRAADLSDGRVSFAGASAISDVAMRRIRKGVGRAGDIIFSHKGTVGKLARVPLGDCPPFVCSPQTTFWRVLDESRLNRDYLYAFMRSRLFIDQWLVRKGETDMADYVSLTAQRQLRVALPPVEVQARIAGPLSAIDALIDNNSRQIDLLDAMAQALYREWFVHFRYPTRGSTPLIESVDGLIPEGWEVRPLAIVAAITMGQSPPSAYYNSEGLGLPFHQGVSHFGIHFPTNRKYCTMAGRTASEGDTLVSVRAPVGRLNVACEDLMIGRGLAAVRSLTDRKALLFRTLKHSVFAEEDSMGGGTIFKAIGKKELEQVDVLCAPPDLEAAAETIFRDNLALLRSLTFFNRELAEIRDLLLPRLVTGEIDVSKLDLDSVVESVA